jgi:ATP-dependent DNA helicase RecG
VLNPGYSLKPLADLGTPGSRLRNPAVAAVLHDLHWAETKGSGIRTMRRLATNAGLPPPEFSSAREQNEFKVILFLHNLLTEDDHDWLKALAGSALSADEAKILIYARETGAVDNTACRDFSGLDTLTASLALRRLRDRGLLVKQGGGNRTYYTLRDPFTEPDPHPEQARLTLFENDESDPSTPEGRKPTEEGCNLELATLPPELATLLAEQTGRLDQRTLRQQIIRLCAWRPLTGEELATLLNKKRSYLRNKHLIPMVSEGQIKLRYPESAKHPHQAYVASEPEQEDRHD